uniref:Actin n=1 Tax=Paramoeba aestuarina TaxID=180227 RepID=A0A7S4KRC8_9EUKA
MCCVSFDPSSLPNEEKVYDLPDGQIIAPGKERYQCPEALFNPSLIDQDLEGIHKLCFSSIMKSQVDIHQELYKNIVLCGGSSMFPGLSDRFAKEMTHLMPEKMELEVGCGEFRQYEPWVGASIMGSLNDGPPGGYITKDEYDENGPAIVTQKCIC